MMRFHQEAINHAASEITELINWAPMDLADWQDIPKVMTRLFPGSFSTIQNYDRISDTFPFVSADGLALEFQNSYRNHFHSVNPFEKHWLNHRSGDVWATDHVMSLEELERTEFYNDWLKRAGSFDSAVGVRIDCEAENELRFNLHFPRSHLENYEHAAIQIIQHLRRPLCRAIEISRYLDTLQTRTACDAALVSQESRAACVIDHRGLLKNSNSRFEQLLKKGKPFETLTGKIQLANRRLQSRFEKHILEAITGATSSNSKMFLQDSKMRWLINFYRVQINHTPGLMGVMPHVLIAATRIGPPEQIVDLSEFNRSFDLTRAESRLCQALMVKRSLSDAAFEIGISYETARSRVKEIFSKTGTSKQTELLLLLNQFGTN